MMATPTQSKCKCCDSSTGIIFSVVALIGLAALGVWAFNRALPSNEDPASKSDRLLCEIEKRLKQLSENQQQLCN